MTRPHNFVRLRSDVKDDLRVWLTFLPSFNGANFFHNEEWLNSTKLNLFTDPSGSIGFGAIFGTAWCYGKWYSNWLHRNIAILEFFSHCPKFMFMGRKNAKSVYFILAFKMQLWSILFHSTLFQTASFTLLILPVTLALFIAYLFERNYAASTVNTYISAIGYSHKLLGLFDPRRVFYIIQMLKGYGSQLDSRLPITLLILKNLLEVSPRINGSHYQICQFKVMYSLAFYAFLRIGEITSTYNPGCQPLQLNQLAYNCDSSNHVLSIKLTFHNFKHDYNERPCQLTITRQPACCPVQLLLEYLALRGNREGAILMTQGGRPVAREVFATQLSETIQLCGLDPNRYKGHSFRIGAASYAAGQVMSESQIRIMGRWQSNA